MLMGVVKQGKETVDTFKDSAKKAAEEAALKDPSSELSRSQREAYAQATGSPLQDTVSAYQIQQNYGPLANINADAMKFKRDKELLDLRGKQELATAQAKLRAEKEANPNKLAFDRLPVESQKEVEKLATTSAGIKSIKNNIDSALEILENPEISETQKIVTGQQLIKALNSAQGADAVGEGEAKRLASLLEYKIANFTGPGSFMGRDLNEFVTQVRLKSGELGQSTTRNQSEIDRLYGREGQTSIAKMFIPPGAKGGGGRGGKDLVPDAMADHGKFSAEDLQAAQEVQRRLQANPQDPVAIEAQRVLRNKGLF